MTARLILGNAVVTVRILKPQAPSPKPQAPSLKPQAPSPKRRELYTTVPGAIVPSLGTMMMPLRM